MVNPTLDAAAIEAAIASDPEGAIAEWAGEFRSDISAFLDDGLIDGAVDHGRPLELPPRKGLRYCSFVDPSGGRGDAFALCIGHREGERFVADVLRAVVPPFDPGVVVGEYAALLKEYRVGAVSGDNYSAAWVEEAFKAAGVKYVRADKPKSQLYLEALPQFTRGTISIPDHPRLLRELRLLERRTHRSGRDTVDHGRGGHDDLANSLAGCATIAVAASKRASYSSMEWVCGPDDRARRWTIGERLVGLRLR